MTINDIIETTSTKMNKILGEWVVNTLIKEHAHPPYQLIDSRDTAALCNFFLINGYSHSQCARHNFGYFVKRNIWPSIRVMDNRCDPPVCGGLTSPDYVVCNYTYTPTSIKNFYTLIDSIEIQNKIWNIFKKNNTDNNEINKYYFSMVDNDAQKRFYFSEANSLIYVNIPMYNCHIDSILENFQDNLPPIHINNFYLFSIVKNPYTRLITFFNTHLHDKLFRNIFKLPTNREITFKEFIYALNNKGFSYEPFSENWLPQTELLHFNLLKYNYILKEEQLEKDFKKINKHITTPLTLCRDFNIHDRLSEIKHIDNYYTNDVANLVYQMYKCDFQNFKYKKSLSCC